MMDQFPTCPRPHNQTPVLASTAWIGDTWINLVHSCATSCDNPCKWSRHRTASRSPAYRRRLNSSRQFSFRTHLNLVRLGFLPAIHCLILALVSTLMVRIGWGAV